MHLTTMGELPSQSRDSLRPLTILAAIFFVATAAYYFYTISWVEPIPRDATNLVIGRDFLNFWMYGRAAATPNPSRFYDFELYTRELDRLLKLGDLGVNWSYPPNIMLAAAPFGQLPYLTALLCWTVLSLAIFWAAMSRVLTDRRLLIPLLLSPAAVLCLVAGQSAFVTTAILIGIFVCLDRRPYVAGVLIALLSLKPQLGLLFPFMLIASARWRVFFTATAATLAIVGITTLLFGVQSWIDYIEKGLPMQSLALFAPLLHGAQFMPTIFMNIRATGVDSATAMMVQVCFSLLAVGAVIWAFHFRRNADPLILAALFLSCSVFGSPYLLVYDLLPLTVAAVLLLASGMLDLPGQRLARFLYWLPALQMAFGTFDIPGPALLPVIFAGYLVRHLHGYSFSRPVSAHA